jgi:hypothetical protein
MTITGTGWGPGTGWSVSTDDGQIRASGTADGSGAFAITGQPAPVPAADGPEPQHFTLTGLQDGTIVASATFDAVNFLVRPRTPEGPPTGWTMWDFSGFVRGKNIYFHIRRGHGKVYTSQAGPATGECGTLTVRLRRIPGYPVEKMRGGKYKVFVDNRRKFTRGGLQYHGTIRIH